ncbi:MAG: SUMF1/EgtB/PvdO family nonheme iron enzyme [Candidatus Promineifilaceae bacterium]
MSADQQRLRGGAWNNNTDNARVAARINNNPNNSNNNIGFRVVAHDFRHIGQKYCMW